MRPEFEQKLSRVREIAASYSLDLVVLFGSHARGDAHEDSDIDIAIRARLALDKEQVLQLSVVFDEIFPCVQVVDLRSAPPLLLGAIVQDGKLLYEGAPSLYEEFCIRAVNEYLDYLPVLEALRAQNTERLKKLLEE